MSNSARMTKGFRRIGIVLAVPLFAVAVLIVVFGAAVEAVHYFDQGKPVSAPAAPAEDTSKTSAERLIQKLDDAIAGKLPEPTRAESLFKVRNGQVCCCGRPDWQ
jgi:hypothetical protein